MKTNKTRKLLLICLEAGYVEHVWARFMVYLGCLFWLNNTTELQNLPDLKAQRSSDSGSVTKSPLVSLLISRQGCHAALATIHLLNSLSC